MGQEIKRPSITNAQIEKWKTSQEISREWYTPYPLDALRASLEVKSIPQSILVVGCWTGNEVFHYLAAFPDIEEVVGIDINREALAKAEGSLLQQPTSIGNRVSFREGNIIDDKIAHKLDKQKFGAAVFTGTITNVVYAEDLKLAFQNAKELLVEGGSIVVSDYFIMLDDEWWRARYTRDWLGLMAAEVEDAENLFGTIVVNPYGMDALSALRELKPSDIARCLDPDLNQYSRLSRHWGGEPLLILEELGCKVTGPSPDRGLWSLEWVSDKVPVDLAPPWDRILNVQYRAVKK